jgi:aquaporin related protein
MDEERMHGMPREYSAGRRPYSESPAPPHPNDQFTGLADGGMHGDEIVKPTHSVGGDSDRTLASAVGSPSSQGTAVHKSAIKPGSRGSNAHGNGNGHSGERSVRSDTSNRNMNSGMPHDEEFYDDKQGI